MTARRLHAVLPEGVDDPLRPSGGNRYDRRVCDALAAAGWSVVEHQVGGTWPAPDRDAVADLGRVLAGCPEGEAVLVDGLVGCCAPQAVLPHRDRLRLVALVHLPLGVEAVAARGAERAVLASCTAVVTTSGWTRGWVLDHYGLDGSRVHVVRPGVDLVPAAARAAGDPSGYPAAHPAGTRLLTVGRVSAAKGYGVLAAALVAVADLPWRSAWVGSLDVDPAFVWSVRDRLEAGGIAARVDLRGTVAPEAMCMAYAAADLVMLPSLVETYGMAVTEAVAHGVPVVAADVGGVRESLAPGPDGRRPGLLVPPDDPAALAAALRSWLTDPALRGALRDAGDAARTVLESWDAAAGRLARVLDAGPAGPAG